MQRSLAVENLSGWDVLLAVIGALGTGGLAGLVRLWLKRNEQRHTERQWEVTKMREDVDRLLARITSLDQVKIALEARIDEQNREILELRGKVMALELERSHLEGRCAKLEAMNAERAKRLGESQ